MSVARPRRTWLTVTTIGVVMVLFALIVAALVVLDKPHFGFLVGSMFLPVMTSGVLAGSIVVLAGAWNLPRSRSWRRIVLLLWGLIALTSPAFGLLFLAPWAVLAVMSPAVIAALASFYKET
jgi:hypothetical protein